MVITPRWNLNDQILQNFQWKYPPHTWFEKFNFYFEDSPAIINRSRITSARHLTSQLVCTCNIEAISADVKRVKRGKKLTFITAKRTTRVCVIYDFWSSNFQFGFIICYSCTDSASNFGLKYIAKWTIWWPLVYDYRFMEYWFLECNNRANALIL